MKTFYEAWNDNMPGFTNNGSFTTTLLKAYRLADDGNMKKLQGAFPDYFVDRIVDDTGTIKRSKPEVKDIFPGGDFFLQFGEGCIFDSAAGQYNFPRIIKLALANGLKGSIFEGDMFTDEEMLSHADLHEEVVDAENYLSGLLPDGYWFGSTENGDWGIWRNDDSDVVNVLSEHERTEELDTEITELVEKDEVAAPAAKKPLYLWGKKFCHTPSTERPGKMMADICISGNNTTLCGKPMLGNNYADQQHDSATCSKCLEIFFK